MEYKIKLDAFEGPLDLLLHLIEKNEVDIYDIPISLITDQYLEYIYQMQELQLDIASEFLVMAATLMEIKSKMLLPKPEAVELDMDLEMEEEDPRDELVERLLQYKQYKFVAEQLRIQEAYRSKTYTRPPGDLTPYMNDQEVNPVESVTLFDLFYAMQKVMATIKQADQTAKIHRDEISVQDKMAYVRDQLFVRGGKIRFTQLFEKENVHRFEIVATFLALLEMMKKHEIECYQMKLFDDIVISLKGGSSSGH